MLTEKCWEPITAVCEVLVILLNNMHTVPHAS